MDTTPRTLSDLLATWQGLEGRPLEGGTCHPEVLAKMSGAAHLGLAIDFAGDARFYVDFWVREIPNAAKPFVLLNTRVSDWQDKTVAHYGAILDLLRRSFPPYTPLVTFVRQSDSLGMLEDARLHATPVSPHDLPLVRMFRAAGWGFLKLTVLSDASDPRRRHLIRFETLPV